MNAIKHLQKDKKLKNIITGKEVPLLHFHQNICLRLCASIMSQQLSTKVAEVIYKRFLNLFGNVEPTPQQVLATAPEVLRSIGLSNAKVQYVLNVAQFAMEHQLTDTRLLQMTNEEITDLLTQIKGVGKWTVEMLLMFTLGREDVFAVDDYGLQMAMKKLYNLDDSNKKAFKQQITQIAEKWSPYRTYACLYLWRWRDDK